MATDMAELLKDRSKWADGFQTRDGRPVRIYAIDGRGPRTVHGAYVDLDLDWALRCWFPDGLYAPHVEHAFDIVPRQVKQKGWINIYRDPFRCNYIHESRSAANSGKANFDRIACIEIEFTEGDGLDS